MSTKAEIKRKKELKKKISLGMKALFAIGLVVLGLIYYSSGNDGNEGNNSSDTYSITETKGGKDSGKGASDSGKKSFGNGKTGDNSSTKIDNIDKNAVVTNKDKSHNNANNDITDSAINKVYDDTDTVKDVINHYTEDGKLDINLATAEELCKLNGIGEKRAADIIEYRETNGNFKKIEDIMKVKGIKQGVFSKIKDYITCPKS